MSKLIMEVGRKEKTEEVTYNVAMVIALDLVCTGVVLLPIMLSIGSASLFIVCWLIAICAPQHPALFDSHASEVTVIDIEA